MKIPRKRGYRCTHAECLLKGLPLFLNGGGAEAVGFGLGVHIHSKIYSNCILFITENGRGSVNSIIRQSKAIFGSLQYINFKLF